MILECEMCATRYLVDTSDIGVLGRMVRCAECGHDWHATTDGAKPSPTPPPVPAPQQAAPATEQAAPSAQNEPAVGGTNLPALVPEYDDRSALLFLFWSNMVLALIALYLVFGRGQIMAAWPPAQHAFAVLGLEEPVHEIAQGLPLALPATFTLQDLEIERAENSVTITGFVQNEGDAAGLLPLLEITEYDVRGGVVAIVLVPLEPAPREITPGEVTPFSVAHELSDPAVAQIKVVVGVLP